MSANIQITAQVEKSIQGAEVNAVFAASAPEALDRAMTRLDRHAEDLGLVVSCETYSIAEPEPGVFDLSFS